MELSNLEKALIYGLSLTPLKKKDILTIPDFLDTEEQQVEMIRFLKKHPKATEQEVFQAMAEIIIANKK